MPPARVSDGAFVPSGCCICDGQGADPVAVGADFECGSGGESYLARRCRGCGSLYLDPAPAEEAQAAVQPAGVKAPSTPDRRLRGYAGRSARAELRIFEDPEHVAADAGGPYERVVLLHALERAVTPRDVLLEARARLRASGRLVIVTPNIDSLEFAVFGTRHWSGFDFPRHRYLFGQRSLEALARRTGFEVDSVLTEARARAWYRSLHHVTTDWQLPRLTRLLPALLPLCAMIEGFARLRGRGAVLVAVLRRSGEPCTD
jgi:hypothetical protein